jgi:hypothetical protein
MLTDLNNIHASKNKLLKIVCLTTLVLGGALQAMTPNLNEQLLKAANHGNIDQIKELLDKGADVNAKGQDDNWTPLMKAAANNQFEVCKLLIEKGADINAVNKQGFTVLIIAALYGKDHPEVCKVLIEKGADVNARSQDGRRLTPLMAAARQGSLEICKLFIKSGADVFALKLGRETALLWAANFNYSIEDEEKVLAVCKLLIDAMIKTKKERKEQANSIVALLAIKNKKQSSELNLVGRDIVQLIGQEAKNEIDRPNAITRTQIMKIQNPRIQKELLDYLNERSKRDHGLKAVAFAIWNY